MRVPLPRKLESREFRRLIERLERLPLRPATPRSILNEAPDTGEETGPGLAESARSRAVLELDPGWQAIRSNGRGPGDPLEIVASTPWWPLHSRGVEDALATLWRHDLAVSLAARRLAREHGDRDPDAVARAAMLHGLGRWAVAAVDPEWIERWLAILEPSERLALELQEIGCELGALGQRLAKRWGLEPLAIDATWLHSDLDRGLEHSAGEPERIVLIQQAYRLAERTPWSLQGNGGRELGDHDPRVKLLTAEVQARGSGPFVDSDATLREESLSRSVASLRLRLTAESETRQAQDRLLAALVASEPGDDPQSWAEVAGLAFCGAPGVATARVVWNEDDSASVTVSRREAEDRPGAIRVPINGSGRRLATVEIRPDPERPGGLHWLNAVVPAWSKWAALVDERARLDATLNRVVRSSRQRFDSEEPRLRESKLEALAEFAAGSGHELNNPLAVIVGRAQLLLVGETDVKRIRSLRAILGQAQRAHRILRDLMYVARPPEPRPRYCNPDEIAKTSLRDVRAEAEDRQVRLSVEIAEPSQRIWTDPEALRHLADSLVRNALEATPAGGLVRFLVGGDGKSLKWSLQDSGRGITPREGVHLFDPFFCGREAGRGLGMGLPRASRYVTLAGGEIRWHSMPGKGSTFIVRLPLAEPPGPPNLSTDGAASPKTGGEGRAAVA